MATSFWRMKLMCFRRVPSGDTGAVLPVLADCQPFRCLLSVHVRKAREVNNKTPVRAHHPLNITGMKRLLREPRTPRS